MKFEIDGFEENIKPFIYGYGGSEPDIVGIINREETAMKIHWAISNNIPIVLHGDIDVDGLSCTYSFKKYLSAIGYTNVSYYINKQRIHGINEEFVEVVNQFMLTTSNLLVIIVDSSSSSELVQELNCDVVIIDHHIIDDYIEVNGCTNNGIYYLSTNMHRANRYTDKEDMSGCMVVYSILQELNKIYKVDLMALGIDQWVGISLFSDVIVSNNKRNQYFIDRVVGCKRLETNLGLLAKELNIVRINKSSINYNLVPILNSASRNELNYEVLNTVLFKPSDIAMLKESRELQKKIIEYTLKTQKAYNIGDCVVMDLTNIDIKNGYFGLIANKLVSLFELPAFVFKTIGESTLKGSFRGKEESIDYRDRFNSIGANAQGHTHAFGLSIDRALLMTKISDICVGELSKRYISMGNITDGVYHIHSIDQFKSNGDLVMLAMYNARVSSKEEILIKYKGSAFETESTGKIFNYSVNSIECKAFERIDTNAVMNLYCEFGQSLDTFIK